MDSNHISATRYPDLTIEQLPVRLKDLLTREICLEIRLSQIETALHQFQQEATELRRSRPPFLFLQAKSTRTEFQQRELNTAESIGSLNTTHQHLTALLPRVRAWVEDDLETFVRDSFPDYTVGLGTHRFPDDWQRALVRFDLRAAGFRSSLGLLQAALGIVPSGVLLSSHSRAFEALMPVRQWAALLDYELRFFNRVAEVQRQTIAYVENTLKRVPEPHFSAFVAAWARMTSESVRKTMMEFRAKLELSVMDARAILLSEASLATSGTDAENGRSFVLPIWDYLRTLARPTIPPERIETILAETEQMVRATGAT